MCKKKKTYSQIVRGNLLYINLLFSFISVQLKYLHNGSVSLDSEQKELEFCEFSPDFSMFSFLEGRNAEEEKHPLHNTLSPVSGPAWLWCERRLCSRPLARGICLWLTTVGFLRYSFSMLCTLMVHHYEYSSNQMKESSSSSWCKGCINHLGFCCKECLFILLYFSSVHCLCMFVNLYFVHRSIIYTKLFILLLKLYQLQS